MEPRGWVAPSAYLSAPTLILRDAASHFGSAQLVAGLVKVFV